MARFRFRIRHKLALLIGVAALLPVSIAATFAARIVISGLEDGLRDRTERQLRVGLNLVLRQIARLGGDAERLAAQPGLLAAISADEAQPPLQPGLAARESQVAELLSREDPRLPSALVQVAGPSGELLGTRAVGGNLARFTGVNTTIREAAIARGLDYERGVTVDAGDGVLVVSAIAPVVDPSFSLRGVVVLHVTLDGDFADGIKGALGSDVIIHAGAAPGHSSFFDTVGGRMPALAVDPAVATDVLLGGTRFVRTTISGREYALGYAPLKSIDGEHIGLFGVAVERDALVASKRAATGSLGLGVAGAILLAVFLSGLLSRGLTRSIAHLHEGALAVARGDLTVALPTRKSGDEIQELSGAFTTMTTSLRDNQDRLAARMREIVALHEAGRAVSSVLALDEVLEKIVASVARVLDTRVTALFLDRGDGSHRALHLGASRAARGNQGGDPVALGVVAHHVAGVREPLRIDDVASEPRWKEAAAKAGLDGTILAVPLQTARRIVGVLVVGRPSGVPAFAVADENLLATFANQAAAAIENARLYAEVRAFSEELEEKVRLRTAQLTTMNAELGRTINELRETQAQLVLSERMAGLGALVAGVAHEINSPSAAIRGAVDALRDNVGRLARHARELGELDLHDAERRAYLGAVEELALTLSETRVTSPAEVRRRARELTARGNEAKVDLGDTARTLAELGAEQALDFLLPLLRRFPGEHLIGYLRETIYLHRNAGAIGSAIKQIQRIVGALKSYSHLDQATIEPADLHDGIENTLAILHHELKYGISVVRRFAELPRVPVYVDELNQVWTNLIHNAVQALKGQGEIAIETALVGADQVVVRVVDDGPGIPAEILPRIFEPFFTTKAKGEGTGLGLGIVQRIVAKHGGRVEVESGSGRTCFAIFLPVAGPPAAGAMS